MSVQFFHLFADDLDEREAAGIRCLPWNLMESDKALRSDALLCGALGKHVVSQMQRIAELEWSDFSKAITDWEIKRYLATY